MSITHETISSRCESTPFVFINTPDGNIRLWWTLRPGAYGYQVYGFCYAREKDAKPEFFLKTSGCGYSKAAHVLSRIFQWLGKKPVGFSLGGQGAHDGCHKWHLGGNYYDIENPSDWEVIQ